MTTHIRRARAAIIGIVTIIIIAVFGSMTVFAQTPTLATAAVAAKSSAAVDRDAPPAIRLLVGRSTIVDAATPISRVSVTSAEIADVLVTTSSQMLLNGKLPGTTSMFVWDRSGAIHRYEVIVQRDVARLSDQIKALFPGETIDVQNNGTKIVLSGRVSSKTVAENAASLAGGYVDKKDDVVSLLQPRDAGPTSQVLLRVRFAEVSRSAMTELGASFFTSPTGVQNTIGRLTTQQFPAPGFTDLQYQKANGNFVHLKVRPEVSTLDFNNAIVLQGFRIPALSTRRAETELELDDHQTFAIAGLLNNSMITSMSKMPGLGDIPILGLLFRSKA